MRKKIAAEIAAPDNLESKKMGRYRGEIEKSMSRLLGILQRVREQAKIAHATREDLDAQPMKFRLRVVK